MIHVFACTRTCANLRRLLLLGLHARSSSAEPLWHITPRVNCLNTASKKMRTCSSACQMSVCRGRQRAYSAATHHHPLRSACAHASHSSPRAAPAIAHVQQGTQSQSLAELLLPQCAPDCSFSSELWSCKGAERWAASVTSWKARAQELAHGTLAKLCTSN